MLKTEITRFLEGLMNHVMRKPTFCICEIKDADQLVVTAKLISAFVFATQIVQSLYFINPKFQASSHLLYLYSPVCVGPGRKPRRPVFSQLGFYRSTHEYKAFALELQITDLTWCSLYFMHNYVKSGDRTDKTPHLCSLISDDDGPVYVQ